MVFCFLLCRTHWQVQPNVETRIITQEITMYSDLISPCHQFKATLYIFLFPTPQPTNSSPSQLSPARHEPCKLQLSDYFLCHLSHWKPKSYCSAIQKAPKPQFICPGFGHAAVLLPVELGELNQLLSLL